MVDTLDRAKLYEAWMQKEHASLFGFWGQFRTGRLIKLCSQFNEFQLFRTLVGDPSCRTLSDIGCAAGGFYRFFRKVWPSLDYKGFDISEVAIEEARRRYLAGDFRVFTGSLKSIPDVESDVVFCRDVVHHQTDPCGFLSDIYDITTKYLILRVRTREEGSTIFDTDQSCQYTYGRWVPYIVFNTSELIDLIRHFEPAPARITLMRHPVVLGGETSRFLPKDLYYPETGTAETALLIEKGTREGSEDTVITVDICPENLVQQRWVKLLKGLAHRWGL